MFRLRPQPDTLAGRSSSGASRTLLGVGPADFFDQERVDATVGIVARNTREPAVDDRANAVDRDGRFGDIGRNHNLQLVVTRDGSILIARREFAVQREEKVAARFGLLTDRLDSAVDLISTRHKHKDISAVIDRPYSARVLPERTCPDIPYRWRIGSPAPGQVLDANRERPSFR